MKAMLLAAGLGTRLRPLTNHTPKPLLPVNGLPIIIYTLALLKKYKIKDVVINLHHLGNQIRTLLGSGRKFGFNIKYSFEPKILGTGGGIKRAEKFLKGSPFLVFNADIIADINLKKLISFHKKKKSIATLVVRQNHSGKFGSLYVDRNSNIISILKKPENTRLTRQTFFTGIHVLDKKFLRWQKPRKKSCIIRNGYIPLLNQGKTIGAFIQKGYWNDLGTLSRLKKTDNDFKKGKIRLSYGNHLEKLRNILSQKN